VVGAASGDPEVARYIATLSELFMSHFRPLPMLKGQGLVSKVLVKVDGAGKVTRREVETSSGNPSWDRAALTAVDQVDTVPLPPEKYRGSTYDYRIIFEER
jgi:TonB family protein